ncbi:MAG: ABC transporter permease [Thermomicrobiales bacterium]
MGRLILLRLLQIPPLLLGITFLTFAIVNLVPGSPVTGYQFNPRMRPEDIERIKRNLGLDEPWPERYVIWLGNVLRGDLGISMTNSTPVLDRILGVLPNTLLLTGASLVLALGLAVPLGVLSAVRHNSLFDHLTTIGSVAAYAVPSFWLALLLIILFAVKFQEWGLPSLPVGGMQDMRSEAGILDRAEHMVLPVISLALVQIASWTRYVRSSMLEVIRQDYILTARAKGLRHRAVVYGHAFRNAMIPLITLVGLTVPELFGGAFLVEQIFAWNGMGRLTLQAVQRSDYTVIMGATLIFALLTMIGNLLADVLYRVLDPRIHYE